MSASQEIYDLIGLGFGPANLAIAGALVERWPEPPVLFQNDRNSGCPRNVLFVEKHEKFKWHPGMLLQDARMQISFLKDLATLRSPRSPITFLSYLHSQNRLLSFINRGSSLPTRKEYADYLSWAASYVQQRGINVLYGHEVISLHEGFDNTIEIQCRNLATGKLITHYARDLVISPGGSPRIPPSLSPISQHPCFIHSSVYVSSMPQIIEKLALQNRFLRIGVIGSGQSATEVALDLRARLSTLGSTQSLRHEVEMVIRKGSLKPSDDSPFANEIFDPAETDVWFTLPSKRARQFRLAEYKSTNYGVVNPRTLDALYEAVYDQQVEETIAARTKGDPPSHSRINIRKNTTILSARITGSGSGSGLLFNSAEAEKDHKNASPSFSLVLRNQVSQEFSTAHYDALVCATGYQRTAWVQLLRNSSLAKHFGLQQATSNVQLISVNERLATHTNHSSFELKEPFDSETPSPTTTSSISTPPTSPHFSSVNAPEALEIAIPTQLAISRKYQLLPVEGDCFKPRIYLQGVEEATHGLSDTLLSVLGVRAGEVVEDICVNYA